MGRIKQGLDYFPLNTDFMHDRVVRRDDEVKAIPPSRSCSIPRLIYIRARVIIFMSTMTSMTNSPTSSSSARTTIVFAGCFICLWSTVSLILSLRTLRHPDFRRHSAAVPLS